MNLQTHGKDISLDVEVMHLTSFGFWILANNQEFFVSFNHFPWFRNATVNQICHVTSERRNHFYWPDLDIDLDAECLKHPERYPLVSQTLS